ncbi:MAG: prenyltransferase/squalene oxidase repeat-containing protein, partial [Planctomycetota bacterium]
MLPPPPAPAGPAEQRADGVSQPEQDDNSLGLATAAVWLEEAPAWLASGLLHLTVLILFALLAIGASTDPPLSLTVGVADDLGEQMIEESLDLTTATELELEEQLLTPDALPEVLDPLATPPTVAIVENGAAMSSDLPSITPGAALTGRTPGRKEALLKALGGTAVTEAAVLEGLKWLDRVQNKKDGGWSLVGKYANGVAETQENREAATAMALLAFQGAGKLPTNARSDFGVTVARGWRWLLKRQQPDGSFFHRGGPNHRFYTHAQCTIALCELLAMTGDEKYRQPATKAIDYLIQTQSDRGGWRYNPGVQSDLSVTGWVLMALKSGRMAGIPVPSPVFSRIEGFLDEVSRSDPLVRAPRGSRYVYEAPDVFNREAVPTLTSVGLLCREYLGWPASDRRIKTGIDFLLTHPPEWRRGKQDVYYWYYATQACLHAGGPNWPKWN